MQDEAARRKSNKKRGGLFAGEALELQVEDVYGCDAIVVQLH
jgi:hypothetical protein